MIIGAIGLVAVVVVSDVITWEGIISIKIYLRKQNRLTQQSLFIEPNLFSVFNQLYE